MGAHLFNTATPDIRLLYWREGSLEVDFVLRRGPRVVAIEVKSGSRKRRLPGMEAFQRRFSPIRSLQVGGDGIPLTRFFSVPAGYWFEEE